MFWLKNWLGHWLLLLLGSLFLLGLVLALWPASAWAGRCMAAVTGLLLLALSLPPLPAALMRPLESHYPALTDARAVALARQSHIHWIVVLGAANGSDPKRPLAAQLSTAGWRRLRAAVHLHRLIPGSRLLLSGGNPRGGIADAVVMAAVAHDMGLTAADLQLETQSRDTAEQARRLAPVLGSTVQKIWTNLTATCHKRDPNDKDPDGRRYADGLSRAGFPPAPAGDFHHAHVTPAGSLRLFRVR